MSQNGNLPEIGVNIKNISNHHLGFFYSSWLFLLDTSNDTVMDYHAFTWAVIQIHTWHFHRSSCFLNKDLYYLVVWKSNALAKLTIGKWCPFQSAKSKWDGYPQVGLEKCSTRFMLEEVLWRWPWSEVCHFVSLAIHVSLLWGVNGPWNRKKSPADLRRDAQPLERKKGRRALN